jgi:MscS family membrane protein
MEDLAIPERLQRFWDIVVDVWQQGLLGYDVGKLLIAFAIILGFLLVRRPFATIVVNRLRKWADKTKYRIDSSAADAIERPVRFIPVSAVCRTRSARTSSARWSRARCSGDFTTSSTP